MEEKDVSREEEGNIVPVSETECGEDQNLELEGQSKRQEEMR